MTIDPITAPHSYLPVGLIHARPTAARVPPVQSRRPSSSQPPQEEIPGPKLLIDLNLLAPRTTLDGNVAPNKASVETNTAANETDAAGRPEECETCQRRRYKDQSNDSSVSFQTPTHLSPAQAEVMVRMHEQEHVRHETHKAKREGKQVKTDVSIHYAVCPECGRVYCAGGTTHVTTAEAPDQGLSSLFQHPPVSQQSPASQQPTDSQQPATSASISAPFTHSSSIDLVA